MKLTLAPLLAIALVVPRLAAQIPPLRGEDVGLVPHDNLVFADSADFDRDGAADLAIADQSTGAIQVVRGDGTGSFVAAVSIATAGLGSGEVHAGEMTGDGWPDLVVRTVAGYSILRNDGAGGFLPPLTPIEAGLAQPFRLADLNHDGRADLVALAVVGSGGPDAVAVRMNLGDGNLAAPVVHAVPAAPTDLAIIDADGDSELDVVLCDGGLAPKVRFLLGDGAGGLALSATAPAQIGPALRVVARDLDGDGRVDLALTWPGSDLLVYRGLGGLAFQPPMSVTLPISGSRGLAAGDVDGDGRVDLVATEGSLAQIGAVVLQHAGFTLDVASFSAGDFARQPALADFDGDLCTDLAIPGPGRVQVARGSATGVLAPKRIGTQGNPRVAAVGDVDGNGSADVVVASNDDLGQNGQVVALRNLGAETFIAAPAVSIGAGKCVDAAFGAFDPADPAVLFALLCTNPSRVVSVKPYSVVPPATKTLGLSQNGFSIAAARLNGDTAEDVVVAAGDRLFFGLTAAGGFVSPPAVWLLAGMNAHGVALGDVDGDGDVDVVLAGTDLAGQGRLRAMLNNGSLGFLASTEIALPFAGERVALGLIDGGPVLDAVVIGGGTTSPRAASLLGLGAGGFAAAQPIALPDHFGALARVELGDLDADGRTDALIAAASDPGFTHAGAALVFHGDGSGGFAAPRQLYADSPVRDARLGQFADGAALESFVLQQKGSFVGRIQCRGRMGAYGYGCPGAGGFVPALAIQGCADAGSVVVLRIAKGNGAVPGLLMFGLGEASIPINPSCTFLLGAVLPQSIAVTLTGAGAGAGELTFAAALPVVLAGVDFRMQAFVGDPSAGAGFTATNAVGVFVR